MADFAPVIAFSLQQEGGFSNNPADSGGPTNLGITLATLSHWRARVCSIDDVRELTKAEATSIYAARYWTPICGTSLPAGIDLMTFDFGVNAGMGRSVKMLQMIIGVVQDGIVGPITLAATECSLPVLRSRIANLASLQEAYYHALSDFPTFGKGWTARNGRRQAAAMSIASAHFSVEPIVEAI